MDELADVFQNDIDYLILGLTVHREYEIIIAQGKKVLVAQ